ncbi:MAG TPA: asparagine synthase (glutamine-hydrolyzing) [Acidimicrobiales bacterium]|nr:asparagine synthase (glutamine-hydrolyzing) [Acidimicrobiales bacterium]
MCGIAGAYQQVDGQDRLERMTGSIGHRGPDDHGIFAFGDDRVDVHLAHRRLSIIDVANGRQPLSKHGLTLSYNGELYNYRELRAELQGRGVRFATASDTEVVLEAWRAWGPACLRRFRGMFAFALFDEASGTLALVRDQLGIKPLFFLPRKDGVVFASELKALVAAFGPELRLDPAGLVASMLFWWVPEQASCLRRVAKLPAGCWAEFRPDGQFRVQRYWDPAAEAAEAAAGPRPDLGAVIEESVSAHLVADVPVSTFLSGGLDSSIIAVLAKREIPDLAAYTIAFRAQDQRLEAMPDDAAYARRVADRYGIALHEIELAPDVVSLLPRLVHILDEPIGDPAAINTLLMCEAARDAGVKVLLSGMGADELFGGYRKHRACVLAARYRSVPGPARRLVRAGVDHVPVTAGGRGLRYARWAKRFVTFCDLPEEAAFRRSYSLYDGEGLEGLAGPDLAPLVEGVIDEHRHVYADNDLADHVNRMCLADTRLFLNGLNLTYTDRASMAASTEVRVPFVDPVVFRAAFAIPGSDKVTSRTGKVALKDVARRWLPDEIVDRRKASFSAPLRAWIGNELRPLIEEDLVRGELVEAGLLRRAALEDLLAEELTGRQDRSKQLWQLLTLELWYRQVSAAGVAL